MSEETEAPQPRSTYAVRFDGQLVAEVQGTELDADDGYVLIRDGEQLVGVYPGRTHSVTRAAEPIGGVVSGADVWTIKVDEDGIARLNQVLTKAQRKLDRR